MSSHALSGVTFSCSSVPSSRSRTIAIDDRLVVTTSSSSATTPGIMKSRLSSRRIEPDADARVDAPRPAGRPPPTVHVDAQFLIHEILRRTAISCSRIPRASSVELHVRRRRRSGAVGAPGRAHLAIAAAGWRAPSTRRPPFEVRDRLRRRSRRRRRSGSADGLKRLISSRLATTGRRRRRRIGTFRTSVVAA